MCSTCLPIPFQFHSSTISSSSTQYYIPNHTPNHSTKPSNCNPPTFFFFFSFSFSFFFFFSSSSSDPTWVSHKRPSTTTPIIIIALLLPLLSFLALFSILLFHNDKIITQWASCVSLSLLPLLCVALALGLVATARATMVTWITVLVLLAFAGNRRRVLVKRGRTITNDVAMFLFGVLVKERGFVAVACAAVFSLLAVVGMRVAHLIYL